MWCPWTSLALPLTRPPPGFSAHNLGSTLATGSAHGVLVLCLTPASPFHGTVERTRCPEQGLWGELRLSGHPASRPGAAGHLMRGPEISPSQRGVRPILLRVGRGSAAVPSAVTPGETVSGGLRLQCHPTSVLGTQRLESCVTPSCCSEELTLAWFPTRSPMHTVSGCASLVHPPGLPSFGDRVHPSAASGMPRNRTHGVCGRSGTVEGESGSRRRACGMSGPPPRARGPLCTQAGTPSAA